MPKAASRPDFEHERKVAGPVAGVDEAGRGPLAGPVVAAAVVFLRADLPPALAGIDDSKRLAAPQRVDLYGALRDLERVGDIHIALGSCGVDEIDRLNVLQASLAAMTRAVSALPAAPAHALIDGNRLPELDCAAEAIVNGDRKSLSIAAASIVAKVTRDATMCALDADTPGYGWARNAGYATRQHLEALARLGPTRHHRRSFAPVRAALAAAVR